MRLGQALASYCVRYWSGTIEARERLWRWLLGRNLEMHRFGFQFTAQNRRSQKLTEDKRKLGMQNKSGCRFPALLNGQKIVSVGEFRELALGHFDLVIHGKSLY